VTALLGAPVGHGCGVEEQHDRPVGEQLRELALGAGLVGELEIVDDVTNLGHGATLLVACL